MRSSAAEVPLKVIDVASELACHQMRDMIGSELDNCIGLWTQGIDFLCAVPLYVRGNQMMPIRNLGGAPKPAAQRKPEVLSASRWFYSGEHCS
ncbi:unnamed protein product [Bursaphelenchus xylophilus]|uniref:(pine wood nematode) hypothetical protein n=1 Tax=Bursaphelenchus xylophilus TaxID=6326 RepID=A0A1I7S369_BURXY|nr:unnamed protein product [Bursaphelenchus xylophilus]CAG9116115.1 unnamed protein product [Bursaphelenchus xylophilus]